MACEGVVVVFDGSGDGGMRWLVGLNDDISNVEMSATNAADDLGEEFVGFFFGGKIGKGKSGVGLNDADGGEKW